MVREPTVLSSRRVLWSGIMVGAVAAVMVQILLTMLGIGVGILSFDDGSDATTTTWVAFGWWAISGIIAAFLGGWFAGMTNAGYADGKMQGLGAWAVSALFVIAAASAATTSTAGIISNVAGPVMSGMIGGNEPSQQQAPQTTGAGASMSVPQAQAAKDHLGSVMLGGFVVLVLGAVAGVVGGRAGASPAESLQRLT